MDLALLRAEGRSVVRFDVEGCRFVDGLEASGETLGGDLRNDGRRPSLGGQISEVIAVKPTDRVDPSELLDEIDTDDIESSRQPGLVGFSP